MGKAKRSGQAIARTFGDRNTREQMLRIAAGYDRMAECLERGEVAIAASVAEVETRSAEINDGRQA